MIRLSTSWMYQQSLNTMLEQQSALANTQNQVSSGKRINTPSDDPAGAAQVVNLDHILASNARYSANIDAANTRLSSELSTLGSVKNVLDSVNDAALQAINGTLSADNRSAIAAHLTQLRGQLLQLANTTDANGQALFAGTSTTKTPFQLDASGAGLYGGNDVRTNTAIGPQLSVANTDTGSALFMRLPAGNGRFLASAGNGNNGSLVVGENSVSDAAAFGSATSAGPIADTVTFGAGGTWSVTDASGDAVNDATGTPIGGTYNDGGSISFNGITLNLTGTPADGDTVSITSGGTQDIFGTLSGMIDTLESDADGPALTNALNRQLESVQQALGNVSDTQVAAGTRVNTLQQKQSSYADLKLTYQTALSHVQDVDKAAAISKLALQATALQASQQVFAKVQSLSLFNYIK